MTEEKVEFNNRWVRAVNLEYNHVDDYTEVLILSDVIAVEALMPEYQSFTCLIRVSLWSNSHGFSHSVSPPTPLPRRVLELWGVLPKMSDVE